MGIDQTSLPILSLTGISKQFPGVKALDDVEFTLLAGEVHALMGENGAGKSTLINIISGLLQPTAGKIRLRGQDVVFAGAAHAQKAGISTITQEFNLVPQLTVAENIFLGRELTGRLGLLNWREIKRHAAEVLNELGLDVPLGQRVSYLSVGDRQLVEIAKALSLEFRIITMDEPTAALNAAEVARLFDIIEKLKRRGIAVLYVSHRLREIFRIADRVTVLPDGKRVATRRINELSEDDVVFPDLTVRENLLISAKRLFHRLSEMLINANEEEKQYQEMRTSLDIRAANSGQRIVKLSGGNQQKVMLGRALMSNSRILLLNEPTRGVDIGTRVEIHATIRKLAQNGYAIIVSSSDIPELVSVSDRCLVLSAGRTKGLLDRAQISEDNITALAIGQEISGDNE